MFGNEELKAGGAQTFPRMLEDLSVTELEGYIIDLQAEIARVEADVLQKKASQAAAASIFK